MCPSQDPSTGNSAWSPVLPEAFSHANDGPTMGKMGQRGANDGQHADYMPPCSLECTEDSNASVVPLVAMPTQPRS